MNLKQKLKDVKSINWNDAIVSFFIVKRKLVVRKAEYKILQVNVDDNLRRKLRQVSYNKITASRDAKEYEFISSDLDNTFLGISTNETDFKKILDIITSSDDIQIADSLELLSDSWIYIARLKKDEKVLYSVRRISDSWITKKVSQFINMIFSGNMLIDIDQGQVLRIDNKIDFFSFDDVIFIADKKNFETALNFRDGMERNRDKIIEEFQNMKLFVDANEVARLVGNNIKRLRKLSQVYKSGYYKQQEFLQNLKLVNESESWRIEYDTEGKLIVNESNIEIILTILNNSRLKSLINLESFDVDVKHKLD